MKKVTFYKEENGVLAVFTNESEGRGMYSCYSFIGQHSTVHSKYFNPLPLATPEEYLPLMLELMRQPYNYDFDVFNVRSVNQLAYLAFTKHAIFEDGLLLDPDVLRHRNDDGKYYIVAIRLGERGLKEYHVKPLNVAGS